MTNTLKYGIVFLGYENRVILYRGGNTMDQERLEQVLNSIPDDLFQNLKDAVAKADDFQVKITAAKEKKEANSNKLNELKEISDNPYQVDYLRNSAINEINLIEKEQSELEENITLFENSYQEKMNTLADDYEKIKAYFNENRDNLNTKFIENRNAYKLQEINLQNCKKNRDDPNNNMDYSETIKNLEFSLNTLEQEYQVLLNLNKVSVENLSFVNEVSFWEFLEAFREKASINDKNFNSLNDLSIANSDSYSDSVVDENTQTVGSDDLDVGVVNDMGNLIPEPDSIVSEPVISTPVVDESKQTFEVGNSVVNEVVTSSPFVDNDIQVNNLGVEDQNTDSILRAFVDNTLDNPNGELEVNSGNEVVLPIDSSDEVDVVSDSIDDVNSLNAENSFDLPNVEDSSLDDWDEVVGVSHDSKFKDFIQRNKARIIAVVLLISSAAVGLKGLGNKKVDANSLGNEAIMSSYPTEYDTVTSANSENNISGSGEVLEAPSVSDGESLVGMPENPLEGNVVSSVEGNDSTLGENTSENVTIPVEEVVEEPVQEMGVPLEINSNVLPNEKVSESSNNEDASVEEQEIIDEVKPYVSQFLKMEDSVVEDTKLSSTSVKIGDLVNIEDGVPIYSNVYDVYANQNGKKPYFGSGVRTVIGISLAKGGNVKTIYANTPNCNDVINNYILDGWTIISCLTTNDKVDVNQMGVEEIQKHAEGFYNINNLIEQGRGLEK